MMGALTGETKSWNANQLRDERQHMGDRSPKSNQKKSNQKQSKANAADQKKQQAVAAKQANAKKR
jgi:hypothetical protein